MLYGSHIYQIIAVLMHFQTYINNQQFFNVYIMVSE